MWVIFPMLAAVTTLFGLTGGGATVTVAVVADQYNKRRGHRRGEGPLSEPYFPGGVLVASWSLCPLGLILDKLATQYRTLTGLSGKRFELTVSEGESLRVMLEVTARMQEHLESDLHDLEMLSGYLTDITNLPWSPEAQEKADELTKVFDHHLAEVEKRKRDIEASLGPIQDFFKHIPTTRIS